MSVFSLWITTYLTFLLPVMCLFYSLVMQTKFCVCQTKTWTRVSALQSLVFTLLLFHISVRWWCVWSWRILKAFMVLWFCIISQYAFFVYFSSKTHFMLHAIEMVMKISCVSFLLWHHLPDNKNSSLFKMLYSVDSDFTESIHLHGMLTLISL